MFPVIRPRLAVARGERLAERHRLHEADLVHRQRFPLKKLELLPITDSNSRCVTSWVTIQKPRVRATSWLVQVTRVNWPGLSACIGIEGLNTTGLGTAGAGGPGRNRTPSKARHTEPTGCYGTGHS